MLLVGVPLVFGAIGIPIEAMHVRVPAIRRATSPAISSFRIFTTTRSQHDFLSHEQEQQASFLSAAKEDFFRTHVPYGAIIYREANRNHLAPELVAAVVEAESDFRPRLVSGKNAQGLMQIIPSTGRDLGVEDLFNPAQNIAGGAKYLRYLQDRFRDEQLALAAYNAGEGNVEKFGGIPPFAETRTYVQRVSFHERRYRQGVQGRYLAALRLRASVTVQ